MIPIPYAVDYYIRVTGREPKFVACEECRHEYVYFLKRAGEGLGTSFLFLDNAGARARATDQAVADLTAALAEGIDPVPCPQCGWYQADMVAHIRAKHLDGLRYVGHFGAMIAALTGGGLLMTILLGVPRGDPNVRPDLTPHGLALLGCVAGLAVAAGARWLRTRLAAAHDPNAPPAADRIARGRSKTVSVAEFVAVLARYEGSRKEALAAEEWRG